jgi:VWFA-related protein
MLRVPAVRVVCASTLALVAGGVLFARQPAQQRPAPSFRSSTDLVSVEVRVVDRQRRPITGLSAADFSISENGKPQVIQHFVPITLTAQPPSRFEPLVERVGTRPADKPSTRRVFLILLGRGELQAPSRGVDGMLHLVRNLLPQDLVAVVAWNRATDFTTNHAQVVALLERYKTEHLGIERQLLDHFSGLRAVYGSRDMPASLQADIDRMLYDEALPSMQTVLSASPDQMLRVGRGVRDELDLALGTPSFDVSRRAAAQQIGMSLDDYAANRVASLQDLARIHAMLAYLRHVDGEKHLVYVSPSGLALPSADDDRDLARVAQDARVVFDIFHTGGVSAGAGGYGGIGSINLRYADANKSDLGYLGAVSRDLMSGGGLGGAWAISSSQNLAELTGGQYTGVNYGEKFADWINGATRTSYQLGYYSTDPKLDGKHRKVDVSVKGRGLEPLYRHGYYARETPAMLDRADMMAQSRIEAALRYAEPVSDLQVAATALAAKSRNGGSEMRVQITLNPEGVQFAREMGRNVAALDVGVFCVDEKRLMVGQLWKRVTLRLSEAEYSSFRQLGMGFTVIVPIRRSARDIKIAVYDGLADRVGTAVTKPKK